MCFSIFSLCNSVLFSLLHPFWSYSVYFGPIQSILSTFFWGELQSYLVCFGLIWSTLVRVGPFCLLWFIQFNLVHFRYFFHSVNSSLIRSIQSTFVLFHPNSSTSVHFVQFGPFFFMKEFFIHLNCKVLSTEVAYLLLTPTLFSLNYKCLLLNISFQM